MRDSRLLLAVAAGYVALVVVLLHSSVQRGPLWLFAGSCLIFAGLVELARRSTAGRRLQGITIVTVAAALQLAAMSARARTSDDAFRYLWDARVQFAGIDPYRYAPSAPALARLRDHQLFPGGACPHPFAGGCTVINRPGVHTIYPPTAQLGFDAVHLVPLGGHGGLLALQVAAGVGVLAVTVLLLRLCRGRSPWPVTLWAWSPLVVLEYGNNAHIDWLAVLLALGALCAARSGRPGRAGVLLALATLTKLYPALIAPALLRRRPAVTLAAAAATAVLLYLPHVLAVGSGVIGFLPGYLNAEGYNSGARLLLLGEFLPHPIDTVVGVLILTGAAFLTYRFADPSRPERATTVLVGTAFLVATPGYGWYAGLLLALCAWSRLVEWVPVALAPGLIYLLRAELTHAPVWTVLPYLVAGLAAVAVTSARWWVGRRRPSGSAVPARAPSWEREAEARPARHLQPGR